MGISWNGGTPSHHPLLDGIMETSIYHDRSKAMYQAHLPGFQTCCLHKHQGISQAEDTPDHFPYVFLRCPILEKMFNTIYLCQTFQTSFKKWENTQAPGHNSVISVYSVWQSAAFFSFSLASSFFLGNGGRHRLCPWVFCWLCSWVFGRVPCRLFAIMWFRNSLDSPFHAQKGMHYGSENEVLRGHGYPWYSMVNLNPVLDHHFPAKT